MAVPLLLVVGAAFVPPTAVRPPTRHCTRAPLSADAVHRPTAGRSHCRALPTQMRFYQRDITFSSLQDERFAMTQVYRLAVRVCSWTADEWALFKAPPHKLELDEKASKKIRGVVIHFIGWGGQGRDGKLEIELEDCRGFSFEGKGPTTKRLVWTTSGSRRVIAEDALFKLVLEDVRRGSLSNMATLAFPKIYPRSMEATLYAIQIENGRLRRRLLELGEDLTEPKPPWDVANRKAAAVGMEQ